MSEPKQNNTPPDAPAPSNVLQLEKHLEPGKLKPITGCHEDLLSHALMNQLVNSLWYFQSSSGYQDSDRENLKRSAIIALEGLAPTSEAEGMLAVQMVACHSAAMECYRRAMIPEQPHEGRQQNLNFANKLMRTYANCLEALDKHRGKGQQKVTVEHVHVYPGGQAIVGNVEGAGGKTNSEDQSHAKTLIDAPEPPMRSLCEDNRESLPQRLNGER